MQVSGQDLYFWSVLQERTIRTVVGGYDSRMPGILFCIPGAVLEGDMFLQERTTHTVVGGYDTNMIAGCLAFYSGLGICCALRCCLHCLHGTCRLCCFKYPGVC